MHQAYFWTKLIIYFVGHEGHVCKACADMPHVLFCYFIRIIVNRQLLNVDNHYDSLIKYAIYLSILAIPALTKNVGIFI